MNATTRVAVCDDALAVKLFLRQVLEEEGDMEVVSATSTGREAVEELGRHRPHALLLDLVLPDVADRPRPASCSSRTCPRPTSSWRPSGSAPTAGCRRPRSPTTCGRRCARCS